MANKLQELLAKKIVVLDGAMGTTLASLGFNVNKNTEILSITNPDIIENVHYRYLMSGADIIYTNTFGANGIKYDEKQLQEVVFSAIACAKKATQHAKKGLICFDMSTLGKLLQPLGTLSFDQAYDYFKQLVDLAKDYVDMFVVETMSDLYELKCAVLAIKENCDKPVIVSMSFDSKGRTFTGCSVEAMVATMQGLNVDVLGINCGLGVKQIAPLVTRLLDICDIEIMLKPNAGLPCIVDGQPVYDINKDEFAKIMLEYVKLGVNVVGGCCGTSDEYIKVLSDLLSDLKPTKLVRHNKTLISSGTKCIIADNPLIIGERINPTGKKLMKEAIINRDFLYFQNQAVEQVEQGAEILDINVGMPNTDEKEIMRLAVLAVQQVVDCPIQIDATEKSVVENGLRYCNGKPLLNSVNGDDEVLSSLLPLVKKYGACVVGLTLDKNGIPKTVEQRIFIAQKIVNAALSYGIPKQDIIIDCLTLTLGASQQQANFTLQAISKVKQTLGVKTILGVSNISFGLPQRQIINSSFLLMALSYGLDFAIVNPNIDSIQQAFYSFRLIANYDDHGEKFIEKYSQSDSLGSESPICGNLQDSIIKGLTRQAEIQVEKLLKESDGLTILDTQVIPALNLIGQRYEDGSLFLPQLLRSSEVAKFVCDIIKRSLPADKVVKGSTVILATVLGDIHDIGKNIVKTVLENYGYNVIDLGKDVPIDTIVDSVVAFRPLAVGLSALMTTTVANMQKTISAIRFVDKLVPICVGGAVLTQAVSQNIGGIYCKDPAQLVKFLDTLKK